jgi:hypothetical protein
MNAIECNQFKKACYKAVIQSEAAFDNMLNAASMHAWTVALIY